MPQKKNPFVIYVTVHPDSYTYGLPAQSTEVLNQSKATSQSFGRIFIARDTTKEDFAKVHQEIAPQLLPLLCRCSPSELAALGKVEFREPNDKVLFTWSASAPKRLPPTRNVHALKSQHKI
jgi:hypothetical protein